MRRGESMDQGARIEEAGLCWGWQAMRRVWDIILRPVLDAIY